MEELDRLAYLLEVIKNNYESSTPFYQDEYMVILEAKDLIDKLMDEVEV